MEKIILKLSNGKISTINTPTNKLNDGYTLVKNIYSVVSPGTEKMLINFGKQNIFNKIGISFRDCKRFFETFRNKLNLWLKKIAYIKPIETMIPTVTFKLPTDDK